MFYINSHHFTSSKHPCEPKWKREDRNSTHTSRLNYDERSLRDK